MNSTPLVSVIVPIYNTEKYLDRCIKSIVNQTYKNLEIILVDDGSTDNCPSICDNWAKIDSRINVIHQKNSGVSAARNIGIKSRPAILSHLLTAMILSTPICMKRLCRHISKTAPILSAVRSERLTKTTMMPFMKSLAPTILSAFRRAKK